MASLSERIWRKDLTFETFLTLTEGSDRAFLLKEDLDQFLPSCCGMANGDGGWIVLGALLEEGEPGEKPVPEIDGVPDAAQLEQNLTLALRDTRRIDANPVSSFHTLAYGENGEKNVLIACVEPADWFLRPLRAGMGSLRGAFRRVEGVNVVSGRDMRLRMALDALELSRDDLPVSGLSAGDLDTPSLASFRAMASERFPQWKALSDVAFLRRVLVLDDAGKVTRAGELLLGKGPRVRLSRENTAGKPKEPETSFNLWRALTELLPRLSESVTRPCADALRECFVNALLYADHDAGLIDIEWGSAATISNPGLPRSRGSEENEPRNYRLLRIFKMTGFASGEGKGLPIIRAYNAAFRLRKDNLELRTIAELPLPAMPAADADIPAAPQKQADPGWMPVIQKEQGPAPDMLRIRPLTGLKKIPAEAPVPLFIPPHKPAVEENASAEDGLKEDELREDTLREASRLSPAAVRGAVLELCSEYRDIAFLASALDRSESSLRRRYIIPLVRDGLLETELPDVKAGHLDQRYRAVPSDL